MKSELLFIVNPIAGHRKGPLIKNLIDSSGLKEKFNVEFELTTHRGHATTLASEAVKQNKYCVVAVGGDGTVNEVGRALNGTDTSLAVIPAGSGNGLARHLKFPADPAKALQKILNGTVSKIDVLDINNRLSLNVSGFGFDGYVAWLFDKSGKRGLSGYTRIALKEYFRYKPVSFNITIDDKHIDRTAHMVVIANASQFGNAAIIAPLADLHDGLMDVIIVNRPPLHQMPGLFYRLFTGKLKTDNYTTMYQCRSLEVEASHPVHLHIDGEPSDPISKVKAVIQPSSLNVIS
ncbi:MAG: YegS/Rv2252/BmrU family lipid kinase [Bacteroidota bacterium]